MARDVQEEDIYVRTHEVCKFSLLFQFLAQLNPVIAGLSRARSARGTEPHTYVRTYVRTRLQIVRVG